MRRSLAFLLVLLASGCAGGPEAQQAQSLLRAAQVAQAGVRSETYTVSVTMSYEGRQLVTMNIDGGFVLKGSRGGDLFMRMRTQGSGMALPVPATDMTVVLRNGRATISSGGRVQAIPVPQMSMTAQSADAFGSLGSLGSLGLDACVKKVDVAEGKSLNGEPATRIAGTLDTACLLKAFTKLDDVAKVTGQNIDLSPLTDHISDIRATLFVSDRSQLLIGGVFSTQLSGDGKKVDVQLSHRITSVNKPVRFPSA